MNDGNDDLHYLATLQFKVLVKIWKTEKSSGLEMQGIKV